MDRYNAIGLIALLILVAALPAYALMEPARMDHSQDTLRQQYAADGAVMYVDNCALCHGPTGEGVGSMPPLNDPDLAATDFEAVYSTIAHSPHGSTMSAWHVERGGILNSYQVRELVTLIQYGDWSEVGELASTRGVALPTPDPAAVDLVALEAVGEVNPHECRACHQEPEVHANRFGLNCARCHTLVSWKPALLTRHIFDLQHAGEGQIACQTCHVETYSANTCYGCHEHQEEQVVEAHAQNGITEIEPCFQCHPTGQPGELEQLREGLVEPENAAGATGSTDIAYEIPTGSTNE